VVVVAASDGSGSKTFALGRVNFLWLGSGRVSHLWFGLEFGKFPLKISIFQFFPFGSIKISSGLGRKVPRSKAGRPLIYCGSKVSSGRVESGPISSCSSFLRQCGSLVWAKSLTPGFAFINLGDDCLSQD